MSRVFEALQQSGGAALPWVSDPQAEVAVVEAIVPLESDPTNLDEVPLLPATQPRF